MKVHKVVDHNFVNFVYFINFAIVIMTEGYGKSFCICIVTGGTIKLTATMQDREHTQIELDKLNTCRNYLQQNGIFDKESFVDFFEED